MVSQYRFRDVPGTGTRSRRREVPPARRRGSSGSSSWALAMTSAETGSTEIASTRLSASATTLSLPLTC